MFFSPLVDLGESPEFSSLVKMGKGIWLRFMLWHGWLPGLSSQSAHPWARNIQEVARRRLDNALGSYDFEPCRVWVLDEHFDAAEVADCMPDNHNMWSDGSCITDDLADISVAGSGVFSTESGMAWNIRTWGHLDDVPLEGQDGREGCRVLCSVPGPLQRAELWRVILALQACTPVFVGVDNKNVVNHVGHLLSGRWKGRPFPLVKDGDLLRIIADMLRSRDRGTVRICKSQGTCHRGYGRTRDGAARRSSCNNLADEAADLGRRRQTERVSTARRICVNACHHWYPLIMDLHRYFIAIARTEVNHDPGHGTVPDPTVWCTGPPAKKAKLTEAVCDFAAALGPDALGWNGWFCVASRPLARSDFDLWPYSRVLLIKFSAILGFSSLSCYGWCLIH